MAALGWLSNMGLAGGTTIAAASAGFTFTFSFCAAIRRAINFDAELRTA